MFRELSILIVLLFLFSCTSKPVKTIETRITHPQQIELNEQYADTSASPLMEEDLKKFKSLNFFQANDAYKIKAHYLLTPDEVPFEMKTSTERLPVYRKYLQLTFLLNGQEQKLAAYQNQAFINHPEYGNSLFIPFLDETNGIESYGGGRYLDIDIPKGDCDSLLLDFNACYNPYCAYNYKYSCPKPPLENMLDMRIEAGVKTGMRYQ